MPHAPLALLCLALSLGCSDSQLYRGSDVAFQNDRLALTGRFCTVDPAQQRFPVKILFLVDTSPEMQALDPDYEVARAVDEVIERYINSTLGNYSFGIIGFGGRAQLLSGGVDGIAFTRQPDLLQNAVQLLRLPKPCQGSRCHDLLSALSLAASLVSGDVLSIKKGDAARTRYIIVAISGGPPTPRIRRCKCADPLRDPVCVQRCDEPSPPACTALPAELTDLACEQSKYLPQIATLVEQVRAAGAKELRFHTMYLRDPHAPQVRQGETIEILQRLSASAGGAFECRSMKDAPSCDMRFPAPRSVPNEAEYQSCRRQAMLCPRGVPVLLGFGLESAQRPFLVKKLIVSNMNTLAGFDGQKLDSDADGLSDEEEALLGTLPDNADSDGDGMSDLVEARLALDPKRSDPPPPACFDIDFSAIGQGPLPDKDGDLLNECEERLLGTDDSLADTDGDGLLDGLELRAGTNYLTPDYLMPSYDHDGDANGDEVRAHTAPRLDDTMEAKSRAYFYDEINEGIRALPYASQPSQMPGVTVLDVSPGATPGAGTLRFEAGPLACDTLFPAPRDASRQAAYERCAGCAECSALLFKDAGDCDFGPAVLLDPSAIRRQGGVSLALESRSASGSCDVSGQPTRSPMLDMRLLVRVENPAVLRRTSISESIVVGTAMRACMRYQVRNISLATPLPDQTLGRREDRRGMNNIYVYFGQAPEGQLLAPGIFSAALLRVRYNPPQRRDPSDPEIVLQQEDFVVLGER